MSFGSAGLDVWWSKTKKNNWIRRYPDTSKPDPRRTLPCISSARTSRVKCTATCSAPKSLYREGCEVREELHLQVLGGDGGRDGQAASGTGLRSH